MNQSSFDTTRFNWSQLNHIQLGRYAEQLVTMEFLLYGFDVFSSEVDDRGVDLVIRQDMDHFYAIQVKSSRKLNYIFFAKETFKIHPNMYAAIVLFLSALEPRIFLVPSTAWFTPDRLFVSRDYEGKKSKPEWGVNFSNQNLPLLEKYTFKNSIVQMRSAGDANSFIF